VDVTQPSACAGPKLSAADNVLAARPTATASGTMAARRQPGRAMANATRHGPSRPNATANPSAALDIGGLFSPRLAHSQSNHGASGWSLSRSYAASCSRSQVTPRPNGTLRGYRKPTGHSISSASVAPLCGTNQRSRSVDQRMPAPAEWTAIPKLSPAAAPSEFSVQSINDG